MEKSDQPLRHSRELASPFFKYAGLAAGFFVAFMLLDSASATAQGWKGAPAFYLPLGLVVALLLRAGITSWPLVFVFPRWLGRWSTTTVP